MQLIFKGRNLEISDRMHSYAEKRLSRLDRFFDEEPGRIELELLEEKNPKIEDRARVRATLKWRDLVLRAEEASPDVYASIDLVADKLKRQMQREHEKRVEQWHGGRQTVRPRIAQTVEPALEPLDEVLNGDPRRQAMKELHIHRTRQFNVGPMTAEDAAVQMELIGHDFFVFVNEDSGSTSVLYRRTDGDLGLIEPALEEQRKGA